MLGVCDKMQLLEITFVNGFKLSASKERPLSIYDGAGEVTLQSSLSNTNCTKVRQKTSIRKSLSKSSASEMALCKILKQNETVLNRLEKLETIVFRNTGGIEENLKKCFETVLQKTKRELFERQNDSYKGLEKHVQQQLIDVQISMHKMRSEGLETDVKRKGKCADDLNKAMREMLAHKEKLAARIYTLEDMKAKMLRKKSEQSGSTNSGQSITNSNQISG